MAICPMCKKEMLKAKTCKYTHIRFEGDPTDYPRIRFGQEEGWPDAPRCHDCNVIKGGLHHESCDVERCPKCKRQMLMCECGDQGSYLVEFTKKTIAIDIQSITFILVVHFIHFPKDDKCAATVGGLCF